MSGSFKPWFSAVPSEGMSLYLSFNLILKYEKAPGLDGELKPFLFEAARTEFAWRPASGILINAGRQYRSDSGGLIFAGLVDGLNGSLNVGKTRLGLGLFYTGLLYKETVEIVITGRDMEQYGKKLDYADAETYFASRRFLTVISCDFPDLSPRSNLSLMGLGQFDLNREDLLHTQYLEARYGWRPLDTLDLHAGGILGIAEAEGLDPGIHFAAAAGADWEIPGSPIDLFSFGFRWAGGGMNDTVWAFIPVSTIGQGQSFNPKFSGLARMNGNYTIRLLNSLSAGAGFSYFIRTDTETLKDAELDGSSDSPLLGGELSGSLVWVPDSAIRINAGGSAFFPGMGGAFKDDAKFRWKISLGAAVSF
jgi:hypothetical protein